MDETFVRHFATCPAGVKLHHAYVGGLLEHVVTMMDVADRLLPVYPVVDRDLVLMGVFLHDAGKTRELTYTRALRLFRRRATGRPHPARGRDAQRSGREGARPDRRALPARTDAPAPPHDPEPPRRTELRQPEGADDARGDVPAPRRPARHADAHGDCANCARTATTRARGRRTTPTSAAASTRAGCWAICIRRAGEGYD